MANMTLYHGSVSIIPKPAFGEGNVHNDYGPGFYCTESLELAKEWAAREDLDGYANKYRLSTDGLRILDLSDPKYTILHWLTLLLKNRLFRVDSAIATEGRDYLFAHFSIPTDEYDVIRGCRADDSHFAFASSFLDNVISIRRLAEAMRLGKLGEQIVLVSRKAFDHLRFLGYEIAESAVYFPLRSERNLQAREAFLRDKRGTVRPDDIFLIDIVRGGIEPDDPRIS